MCVLCLLNQVERDSPRHGGELVAEALQVINSLICSLCISFSQYLLINFYLVSSCTQNVVVISLCVNG